MPKPKNVKGPGNHGQPHKRLHSEKDPSPSLTSILAQGVPNIENAEASAATGNVAVPNAGGATHHKIKKVGCCISNIYFPLRNLFRLVHVKFELPK